MAWWQSSGGVQSMQVLRKTVKRVLMSTLFVFVWFVMHERKILIRLTHHSHNDFHTRNTSRITSSGINNQQMPEESGSRYLPWGLTRAEFFTHFLMTSPVAWPVSGAALEIAEGRDCKYQLITEIPHADRRSGASQLASTLHILKLNL